MRPLIPLALLALSTPAAAQIAAGPDDDVEAILDGLSPGDEVILADGTYTLTERFSFRAQGTASAPIVIRAADGARPHFHRPDASQNIWDIELAEHVTIRGIEFSGGSAGLRVSGADHLSIEECEIHDTADVALRMNDGGVTYRDVRIVRNHIHDTDGTGEGMYLGCNEDGCRLADCLIAENYVHHTNGPDVSQGDGIELKEGSHGCVIRDNVIHDTGYPCILGYGTNGNGADNVVERNVVWSCGDHGIQWESDAILSNNIVLGAANNGIATQPHQDDGPDGLVIVHNTVLNASMDALSVRNASGEVLVANNALYAESGRAILVIGGASSITIAGNVGLGAVEGASGGLAIGDLTADFAAASFSGAVPNDVFPRAGGALVGAGDMAHVVELDFEGRPRRGVADVGAYAFGDGDDPGWTLAEGFKPPITPVTPTPDGGTPSLDGGAPSTDAGTSTPLTDAAASPDPDAGLGGSEDGGCGCRAVARAGSSGPGEHVSLALAVVVYLVRRARFRGRSAAHRRQRGGSASG